jgi:glutathione peroxidase-family protein
MTTLHDFEALSIEGKPAHFSTQRGKVVLIVNTASACGFTPSPSAARRAAAARCSRWAAPAP